MLLFAAFMALAQGTEVRLGPGGDIPQAIQQAGPGGVVTLAPGMYAPGQIAIDPSAAGGTLRSAPGGRAKIDFGGRGGFYITAEKYTLKDLDILNARNFAVDIDASHGTVDGCRLLGSGGDALKLSPGPWPSKRYHRGATVRGCEIGGNKQFEGIDCVGHDDVRVLNCYIHDTPGWGVYLKGGASRGLVEGCVFERCGNLENNPAGGACLGEHTGPDAVMTNKHGDPWENVDGTVRNCLFIDIYSAALAAWCARGAKFQNNTIVNAATRDRASIIVLNNHNRPCQDVSFVNNIVVGSKEGGRPLVWIYPNGASGGLVLENNLYFGGNGKFWDQRAGGPVDFETWKASGQDKDSLWANPGLDPDFRLKADSPCIGKGRVLPGFAADIDGAPRGGGWDLGADEFGSGSPRPYPGRPEKK
jgi:hypothetical protein